jgi:hypothetical protein
MFRNIERLGFDTHNLLQSPAFKKVFAQRPYPPPTTDQTTSTGCHFVPIIKHGHFEQFDRLKAPFSKAHNFIGDFGRVCSFATGNTNFGRDVPDYEKVIPIFVNERHLF